jgi:hypothetical protein
MGETLRRRVVHAAVGVGVAAVVAVAAPANAVAWYSQSSPLKAYDDGVVQAAAHGYAYRQNGELWDHTYYRDPRPCGDSVYTQTDYSYYEPNLHGDMAWGPLTNKDQSARWCRSTWTNQYDADDYSAGDAQASQGRVFYKVCEDQRPFNPDPCSRHPWVTFGL